MNERAKCHCMIQRVGNKMNQACRVRSARFYAGAVQLANLGALTRIILSGVLLSKF